MLRYALHWFLENYTENELKLERREKIEGVHGEEWKTQPLISTIITKCLDIIKADYPRNGPGK